MPASCGQRWKLCIVDVRYVLRVYGIIFRSFHVEACGSILVVNTLGDVRLRNVLHALVIVYAHVWLMNNGCATRAVHSHLPLFLMGVPSIRAHKYKGI